MGQELKLKKRIASIKTISKITKAMELVATAKLKRAGKLVTKIKPYFTEVYSVFHSIINEAENSLYLEEQKKVINKTLWIVINSNFGFCGGYNNNVNKLVIKNFGKSDAIIAIGSKATIFFTNNERRIIESYNNFTLEITSEQVQPLALKIISSFNSKQFDAIQLVYTKFTNSVTFEPVILQLLPIIKSPDSKNTIKAITEFEPDATTVLEQTISFYLNTVLFSAIAESQVSEQASRRLAMENASNNGNELQEELLIKYNRSRQATVTQELAEIIGAVESQN